MSDLALATCLAQSSEKSIFDTAAHEVKLLMMYTRATFYASEPNHAAAYGPVEACGAHEWSYVAYGWRALAATQPPALAVEPVSVTRKCQKNEQKDTPARETVR